MSLHVTYIKEMSFKTLFFQRLLGSKTIISTVGLSTGRIVIQTFVYKLHCLTVEMLEARSTISNTLSSVDHTLSMKGSKGGNIF